MTFCTVGLVNVRYVPCAQSAIKIRGVGKIKKEKKKTEKEKKDLARAMMYPVFTLKKQDQLIQSLSSFGKRFYHEIIYYLFIFKLEYHHKSKE